MLEGLARTALVGLPRVGAFYYEFLKKLALLRNNGSCFFRCSSDQVERDHGHPHGSAAVYASPFGATYMGYL